ncbi:hypothetical protein B0H13DRAFT_1922364 [Mycena leptocephala]|nr:hypothetical protein B0H13DRAFT_1922364 [Mycena leptocephala]
MSPSPTLETLNEPVELRGAPPLVDSPHLVQRCQPNFKHIFRRMVMERATDESPTGINITLSPTQYGNRTKLLNQTRLDLRVEESPNDHPQCESPADAGSHTRAADYIGLTKGSLVRNLTTDGQHCAGREDSFHAAVSDLTPMNTSQQEPLRMVLNLLHV